MPSFKEYTMMFQLSAATSAQFSSAFSGAQSQITQLQSRIEALNKQQGDITAYTRQQAAIEKTKGKLEMYRQQYENLRQAQEKAGGSDVDLQNKMLAKQMQIDKTNASLEQQEAKLDRMGNALEEAGIDTQNLTNESQRLDAELSTLRGEQDAVADSAQQSSQGFATSAEAMQQMLVAAGVVDLLKNIGGALKECADASIQYESAMAGVKRTVGGSDAFINGLGEDFKYLSTVIPITSTELAGIATTAGQLGIAQSNVEQFTTVMAKLATTTDLTADDAATMLAQFANITGTTDYERLGSAVASLGDATATTASKVVQMSQGMAASASQAGMSETDILGISAAVGSLGIEAQAGSTAMSTLISTLYKSVETGDKLEQFASVAGMTAEQFKTAWAQDAAGAMNSFIMGLNDVERNGKSAVVILDELGINNVRQTKAILGLASAEGLLTSTIQQANQAWQDNTALDEKAAIMYETTEAKINMMQNAFSNIKIAVGDALTPALAGLAEMATKIMQPIAEFLSAHPGIVRAITAAVGVIATVTGGLMALSVAMKVVGAAAAIMTAAIPGLPLILGITAGIAGLVGVVAALAPELLNATKSFEDLDAEFDDSMEQIRKQQEIIDLCDQYRQLQSELDGLQGETKIDVSVGDGGPLTYDDFVNLPEADKKVLFEGGVAVRMAYADFINLSEEDKKIIFKNGVNTTLSYSDFVKLSDDEKKVLFQNGVNKTLTLSDFMSLSDDAKKVVFANSTDKTLTLADFMALSDEERKVKFSNGVDVVLGLSDFMALSDEDKKVLFNNGVDVKLGLDDFSSLTDEQKKILFANGVDGVLSYDDFVSLTPEQQSILFVGQADPNAGKLTASDFVEGKTVTITPDLDVDALNQKLATLKADLTSTGTQLTEAKQTLSDMQSEAETLNNKMLATNEKAEKAAYAEQLEVLNGQIEDQKTVVNQLTNTYDSLNAEYETTQTTVDAVAAKQAELANIKEQLIASSGGLITATDAETEAFNSQVDALQALAEMKQSEIREQAYTNIVAQSKAYAEAAQNISEYQKELDAAKESQSQTIGAMNGGVDELQSKLDSAYESLSAMLGGDGDISWDSEGVQAYVSEIENLLYLMTGEKYDFNHMAGLAYEVANAQGSYEAMQTAWQAANAEVEKYANAVLDAEGTQQDFLDNLVAGVRDGGMSLEYLEGLLNEQFANTEGGADLVANAMAYVREQIDGAADAADDLGDSVDGAGSSALEMQTAIQPIIDKMTELKQAYDEAYESAKSSLDGQFELFEQLKRNSEGSTINISSRYVNTGDNSLREGLQTQMEYFEEYNNLLQQAQQKGVDTDLLATLADGSMESAETLKRLVADTTTAADIEAMNAAYDEVQTQKDKLAQTMADITTDFSDTMSDLQSQMTDTIGEMEMSSEAAAAAQNTFSAMASEADAMLPTVRAAYQRIAAAAQAALNSIHAPKVTIPGGVNQEYAEGTDYAAPGVALVGEHGPELVMMNGGEQVFTAAETAAILSKASQPAEALPVVSAQSMGSDGSTYAVTLSPVYNISGNASAADIEAILKAHDAELIETVKNELADLEVDKARRSYT